MACRAKPWRQRWTTSPRQDVVVILSEAKDPLREKWEKYRGWATSPEIGRGQGRG
jgi:hypothetical protein